MIRDRILIKIANRLRLRSKKLRFVIPRKPVYFNRHLNEQSDFLILTTGPSLGKYREEIRRFIDRKGPVLKVMTCNFINGLCIPDYHIILNRKRLFTFAHTIHEKSILLLPPDMPKRIIKGAVGNRYYERVMFKGVYFSQKGSLKIDKKGIIYAKGDTVATIACGVALVMGAKNIFLAGLDGFSMYQHRPDDIHFFPDSDSIPFDRRLMQERCTHDILRDAENMLRERGGQIKVITPTVYEEYYDGSILKNCPGTLPIFRKVI